MNEKGSKINLIEQTNVAKIGFIHQNLNKDINVNKVKLRDTNIDFY